MEESFLEAIRTAPDDDVPRLIFADWLDDHGDSARAEFIRIQVDLARLPSWSPRVPELRVREGELLLEHERAWLGDWADDLVHWRFRRGLLHAVKIDPVRFAARGMELFGRFPVERVAFVDEEGGAIAEQYIRSVCAAPAMRFVRAIETPAAWDDWVVDTSGTKCDVSTWLAALSEAKHAISLEEAMFPTGEYFRLPIDARVWRGFCRAGHLRGLRRLNLAGPESGLASWADFLAELAQAPFAATLRSLSLADVTISDDAATVLANGSFVRLEELDLSGCVALGSRGLEAVLDSSRLPNLVSLGTSFGPEFGPLATERTARLRCLCLRDVREQRFASYTAASTPTRSVRSAEWERFSRSEHLDGLTSLSIRTNDAIPDEATAAFLAPHRVARLEELCYLHRGRSAAGYGRLLSPSTPGPTALRSLHLPMQPALSAMLAAWPGLAGLLDLSFDQPLLAGDVSARVLLESPHLSTRLGRLDLSVCCTWETTFQALAGCAGLAGLRALRLCNTEPTAEMMRWLIDAMALRELETLHFGPPANGMDRATVEAAFKVLSDGLSFPRLRDVTASWMAEQVLRKRFGSRFRRV